MRVAGELDHLHAVEQRRRHRVELVRGGDEEDVREVERQVQVVVAEGRVLLGVEHLEHRARRVAAEVRAHLVDLVDHQHRVVRAGVAHRADDRAGHRADVGAAVPADLRLVAHAAHRDALELAAHRLGDRAAQRGLADAGRSDEAEDRGARVRLQLAHGEELEDAVLHGLDVVVVAVERLARVLQVEVVLGLLRPRQRREPLEVGADHAVLGGLRRAAARSAGARARPPSRRARAAPPARAARAARRPRPGPRRPRRAPPGSPSAAGAGSTRAGPCPSPTGPGTGCAFRSRRARAPGPAPRRAGAGAWPRRAPRAAPASPRS